MFMSRTSVDGYLRDKVGREGGGRVKKTKTNKKSTASTFRKGFL